MNLPLEGLKREIIDVRDETTDENYGIRPENRDIKQKLDVGLILLDKPAGIRSRTAAVLAKKMLQNEGVEKLGYSGTLDPAVTGLLPLTINRANKVVSTLLFGGKEYVGVMHLHKDLEIDRVKEAFDAFKGKIKQLPPVRSNVKRQTREREVYYLDLVEMDGRDVLFRSGVQSGTYIRKLVHDMGEFLGSGANMAELRRTKVTTLDETSHLVTLQDLEDAVYYYEKEGEKGFLDYAVQNIEDAICFLPNVWISDYAVDTVCHGSPLAFPGLVKTNEFISGETVAILTLKGELIGIGNAVKDLKDILTEKKGLVIKTDAVVMKTGVYPKYTKKAL